MFLRNYWYVAAWSREITREPIGRIILNEPVVMFRREDGTPVALEDRCIHRRLPLSMGKLIGDNIQCHYHGLEFDGTGACVWIPGQERIPPAARVKSFPVVDRHTCIWIWMGDPANADESLITDFSVLTREGWTSTGDYTHTPANYLLIVDNLLDLSHLATVHNSTVGTQHVADLAEVETEREGNNVRVTRWTMDVPPARTYREFGKFEGNVDRWQKSEFLPPSFFRIHNGAASAGTGAREGKGENHWSFRVCHGITPETETTTHYFWVVAHELWVEDSEAIAEFHRQVHQVISEDVAVFSEQQRSIDLVPSAPTLDIRYDAGPNLARQIVDDLLKEEAAQAEAKSHAA